MLARRRGAYLWCCRYCPCLHSDYNNYTFLVSLSLTLFLSCVIVLHALFLCPSDCLVPAWVCVFTQVDVPVHIDSSHVYLLCARVFVCIFTAVCLLPGIGNNCMRCVSITFAASSGFCCTITMACPRGVGTFPITIPPFFTMLWRTRSPRPMSALSWALRSCHSSSCLPCYRRSVRSCCRKHSRYASFYSLHTC